MTLNFIVKQYKSVLNVKFYCKSLYYYHFSSSYNPLLNVKIFGMSLNYLDNLL